MSKSFVSGRYSIRFELREGTVCFPSASFSPQYKIDMTANQTEEGRGALLGVDSRVATNGCIVNGAHLFGDRIVFLEVGIGGAKGVVVDSLLLRDVGVNVF